MSIQIIQPTRRLILGRVISTHVMSSFNNLKHFRKERGFSQEYVADKLNMDQSAYSRLERKEHICTYRLNQLASLLDVSPEELITPLASTQPAATRLSAQADDRLQQQEDIIRIQSEEIVFLRRQLDYLQAVWRQYCERENTSVTGNYNS